MNKVIGGVCLIAGTAIGSGMLSLPMILSSFGVLYGSLLMVLVCVLTYYTSLVILELNLQAKSALSLGMLGRFYSGHGAEVVGSLSLKILSYALLAVYISGGTSVFQKMIENSTGSVYDFNSMAVAYVGVAVLILSFSVKVVDQVNRWLFYIMLAIIGAIILGLLITINWSEASAFGTLWNFEKIRVAVPIVLTSFGFQTVFGVLVDYCEHDRIKLRSALRWGCVVQVLVYMAWIAVILVTLRSNSPAFYEQMIVGKVNVGMLVQELSRVAEWHYMQVVIWWLSVFAIITSVIGVGIGLIDSWRHLLKGRNKTLAIIISFLPPLIIALLIPNAFIAVLSFAGMILVVIAILLPLYLLQKAKIKDFNYPILRFKTLQIIAALVGVGIIIMEILNMIAK